MTLASQEQAVKLLCQRKENRDVQPAYVRDIIGWRHVQTGPAPTDPNSPPPEKPAPRIGLAKAMHNAGGKE